MNLQQLQAPVMAGTVDDSGYLPRFNALWTRCSNGAGAFDGNEVFRRLATAYAEPQRRYHTFAHIAQCLSQFDRAVAGIPNGDVVEMALWFHDAVYVPGAADNERRSVEIFREWAGADFPARFVADLDRLIMATTHHAPPVAPDERWIADVDLSSFGLPWQEFMDDSRNVRAERADLADAAFYAGQSRFLQGLLDRERIFQTDHFNALLETTARSNITGLLALIAQGHAL